MCVIFATNDLQFYNANAWNIWYFAISCLPALDFKLFMNRKKKINKCYKVLSSLPVLPSSVQTASTVPQPAGNSAEQWGVI